MNKKDVINQEGPSLQDSKQKNISISDKPPKKESKIEKYIIIFSVIILILGIIGWLTWKFFFYNKKPQKTNSQTSSVSVSKNPSPSPKKLSKLDQLLEVFKYPETTSFNVTKDVDYKAKAEINMVTKDSVKTVYDYYLKLSSLNSWELGRQGLATDESGAFLVIEPSDFRAELEIEQVFEDTNIKIAVYYEEEVSTSRLEKPDNQENIISEPTPPSDWDSDQNKTQTPITKKQISTDYIIPGSNSREINEEELSDLSFWELKLARNEIYARHGRKFEHQDLSCYFAKKPWYTENSSYSPTNLSTLENNNAVLILNYEKKINSPLFNYDSGCL